MYDLLITGARVMDGSGSPWYWGDVAVQGDRIAAVGVLAGAAARRIGCMDRGLIRPGFMADLVVFDPHSLRDTANYIKPRSHPEGIDFVAVNGVMVVADSQPTGALPGRALRRGR